MVTTTEHLYPTNTTCGECGRGPKMQQPSTISLITGVDLEAENISKKAKTAGVVSWVLYTLSTLLLVGYNIYLYWDDLIGYLT